MITKKTDIVIPNDSSFFMTISLRVLMLHILIISVIMLYRYRDVAFNCISKANCYSIVYNVHRQQHPTLPRSFRGLGALLTNYEYTANMYRGEVTAGEGTAHIFIDDFMLQQLSSAQFIHLDGTFKVSDFYLIRIFKNYMLKLYIY